MHRREPTRAKSKSSEPQLRDKVSQKMSLSSTLFLPDKNIEPSYFQMYGDVLSLLSRFSHPKSVFRTVFYEASPTAAFNVAHSLHFNMRKNFPSQRRPTQSSALDFLNCYAGASVEVSIWHNRTTTHRCSPHLARLIEQTELDKPYNGAPY